MSPESPETTTFFSILVSITPSFSVLYYNQSVTHKNFDDRYVMAVESACLHHGPSLNIRDFCLSALPVPRMERIGGTTKHRN